MGCKKILVFGSLAEFKCFRFSVSGSPDIDCQIAGRKNIVPREHREIVGSGAATEEQLDTVGSVATTEEQREIVGSGAVTEEQLDTVGSGAACEEQRDSVGSYVVGSIIAPI